MTTIAACLTTTFKFLAVTLRASTEAFACSSAASNYGVIAHSVSVTRCVFDFCDYSGSFIVSNCVVVGLDRIAT